MQAVSIAVEQVFGLRSRAGWESGLELGATFLMEVAQLVCERARRHTKPIPKSSVRASHSQDPSTAHLGFKRETCSERHRKAPCALKEMDHLQVAAHTLRRPSGVLLLHTKTPPC